MLGYENIACYTGRGKFDHFGGNTSKALKGKIFVHLLGIKLNHSVISELHQWGTKELVTVQQ